MKVLVSLKENPPQRYLIHLFTERLIREVRDLIQEKKHSQAVAIVFNKGAFDRKVRDDEMHAVEADLILSETNASWDLTL